MGKSNGNRALQLYDITWGMFASVVTVMGAIFGAGYTIGKTIIDIQRNEEVMQLNQNIFSLREKHYQEIESYSEKIHELRIEIYELKEELLTKQSIEK